jgi:glycosyltransferase involved in cell wall biosynthesis
MAPYALVLGACPKILEEIELGVPHDRYALERHPLRRARSGLTWWKLTHYVDHLLGIFDGCTVVSEREQELVRQVSPHGCPVEVVPNGVDTAAYDGDYGPPEADTLVYAGSLTYRANLDAMDFFLREVYPSIRAGRPGVRLYVTGRLDGVATERLPGADGVVFTGYLDDVRPRIARSWASIVPLREGGGTRLKVLESLALGTPVVATSKGAEGLHVESGHEILLADGPEAFAQAVLRMLGDPALRAGLAANGKELVRSHYDWQRIGQVLDRFTDRVVHGHEQ